jgi:hypothetical protein
MRCTFPEKQCPSLDCDIKKKKVIRSHFEAKIYYQLRIFRELNVMLPKGCISGSTITTITGIRTAPSTTNLLGTAQTRPLLRMQIFSAERRNLVYLTDAWPLQ